MIINWIRRPHVALYLFAPFLISRRTDATNDLTACMLVCLRIRYLVLCTWWQKRNIVTMSALNSDNVSHAFDLFLSFSFSSSLSLSLPPVLGLIFASSRVSVLLQLSLPLFSPSLFPHFSPCRQRRRIMNRGSVSDTKALPAMTTPESS